MAQRLVYVSTNVPRSCPVCGETALIYNFFEDACNHLLEHGLKLLHVGQETGPDENGKPWHSTVAVFEGEIELRRDAATVIAMKP